ncbi:MAG: ribonuclease P protein component [Rubrivivax sp.]|nr:ribonuclease P protein component [Rubrivivax sp.]
MLRALVHRVDFERLLAIRPTTRSAHFALHHAPGRPQGRRQAAPAVGGSHLSTSTDEHLPEAVDKVAAERQGRLPVEQWIGAVVPKRQVRRAVMRNLLKRQVRSAFLRHEDRLAAGLWLVRVKQGFSTADFPSAASASLRRAVCQELDALLSPVAGVRPGGGEQGGGSEGAVSPRARPFRQRA